MVSMILFLALFKEISAQIVNIPDLDDTSPSPVFAPNRPRDQFRAPPPPGANPNVMKYKAPLYDARGRKIKPPPNDASPDFEETRGQPSDLYDLEDKVTVAGKWPEFIAKLQEQGAKVKGGVMKDWEENAMEWADWAKNITKPEKSTVVENTEKPIIRFSHPLPAPATANPSLGMESYWEKEDAVKENMISNELEQIVPPPSNVDTTPTQPTRPDELAQYNYKNPYLPGQGEASQNQMRMQSQQPIQGNFPQSRYPPPPSNYQGKYQAQGLPPNNMQNQGNANGNINPSRANTMQGYPQKNQDYGNQYSPPANNMQRFPQNNQGYGSQYSPPANNMNGIPQNNQGYRSQYPPPINNMQGFPQNNQGNGNAYTQPPTNMQGFNQNNQGNRNPYPLTNGRQLPQNNQGYGNGYPPTTNSLQGSSQNLDKAKSLQQDYRNLMSQMSPNNGQAQNNGPPQQSPNTEQPPVSLNNEQLQKIRSLKRPTPTTTVNPLASYNLPKIDDFGAPIRWVEFNSEQITDGLAKTTDIDTGTNRQYNINGSIYVPIIDNNPERLGYTTAQAPPVLSNEKSALRTMVNNVDLSQTNDQDWLAVEASMNSNKQPPPLSHCSEAGCKSRCQGMACHTTCTGDTCSNGCVGPSCSSSCQGSGCLSMCIGDKCTSKCQGMSCDARCRGVDCDTECELLSCSKTVNGETKIGKSKWDQLYPQYGSQTGGPDYNGQRGGDYGGARGDYGGPGGDYGSPNGRGYGGPNGGDYGGPNGGDYGGPNGGDYGAPNGGDYKGLRVGNFGGPNEGDYGDQPDGNNGEDDENNDDDEGPNDPDDDEGIISKA